MSKKKSKKKESGNSPLRSKSFTIELYPEWSFYMNIIAYIQAFKHAFIIHDKDVKEDGTIKKEHCHLVLVYGGRRTLSSVQNEFKKLQVEPRFVQTCNERAMLRYLTHKDDLDKYQYSRDEIITNMPERVQVAYQDEMTPEIAFNLINEFIDNQDGIISQSYMNKYLFENNLLMGLRRYSSAINNALREHNKAVDNGITRLSERDFLEFKDWQIRNARTTIEAMKKFNERESQKEKKKDVFD